MMTPRENHKVYSLSIKSFCARLPKLIWADVKRCLLPDIPGITGREVRKGQLMKGKIGNAFKEKYFVASSQ